MPASRALAVESVASIVELNYPRPDTARMIAAHVRGRHASNAYDTIPTMPMVEFLVSHFMPPEVRLVSAFSPATGETTHQHTLDEVPGPRRLDVPLYVLVDGRSGSAGEVAPFVLQNLGRATIVGERTAGAGRSASFFPAELGLSVSVSTLQLYEESSGRSG